MLDSLFALLSAEGITATGILLAVLVVFACSLHWEWIVMGARWTAKCAECAELKAANKTAAAELAASRKANDDTRDELTATKIELTRLRTLVEGNYRVPPSSSSRRRRSGGKAGE